MLSDKVLKPYRSRDLPSIMPSLHHTKLIKLSSAAPKTGILPRSPNQRFRTTPVVPGEMHRARVRQNSECEFSRATKPRGADLPRGEVNSKAVGSERSLSRLTRSPSHCDTAGHPRASPTIRPQIQRERPLPIRPLRIRPWIWSSMCHWTTARPLSQIEFANLLRLSELAVSA